MQPIPGGGGCKCSVTGRQGIRHRSRVKLSVNSASLANRFFNRLDRWNRWKWGKLTMSSSRELLLKNFHFDNFFLSKGRGYIYVGIFKKGNKREFPYPNFLKRNRRFPFRGYRYSNFCYRKKTKGGKFFETFCFRFDFWSKKKEIVLFIRGNNTHRYLREPGGARFEYIPSTRTTSVSNLPPARGPVTESRCKLVRSSLQFN